jgi:hypothetical protein
VLDAIVEVWRGMPVQDVLNRYKRFTSRLPGYSLEYILYGLNWILEQEDINYPGRPPKNRMKLMRFFKNVI